MNKTILGVAMVVVFCITWWLVAGEAMQASQQAEQAYQQAEQTAKQAKQAHEQAMQTAKQAEQAYIIASSDPSGDEAFREYHKQLNYPDKTAQQIKQLKQTVEQANQAFFLVQQAYEQAKQTAQQAKQAYEQAKQTAPQAKQASIMADAHFRTQASWGIGAGLLADVLLLVGALAWSKLTAKA